jgi:SAM-dependent methyltransferase
MSRVRDAAHTAYSAALLGEPCHVLVDGEPDGHRLAVARWQAEVDAADAALLDLCQGPTVDIGCGPGRLTRELLGRGTPAMGIDIVPEAVRQTRARGGLAVVRDVFALVPAEGRWGTALLADGNIGIGGDPVRLLRRSRGIVSGAGRVVVELDEPGGDVRRHRVVLRAGSVRTPPFAWAVVPADRIADVARPAGLEVVDAAVVDGRWFAALEAAGESGRDA